MIGGEEGEKRYCFQQADRVGGREVVGDNAESGKKSNGKGGAT